MSDRATDPVAEIEVLPAWEGPAKHAPGVLFEPNLSGEVSLLEFANWVAWVAVAGVIGNAAFEAIKQNVLRVLAFWRRQKGQSRLDELKQTVFEETKKHRAKGKLTEEELSKRIDAFFAEIQG